MSVRRFASGIVFDCTVLPALTYASVFSATRKQDEQISDEQRGIERTRLGIKTFVLNTLRKGPQGLIAEFRAMKRGNDFTKMTEFLAQNPNGKNRYKDVGCLDNNRVILTVGSCSYIHANYVSTPDNPKRFICTQAPLPSTCAEFWCMVVQESSDVILMLCNFIEQVNISAALLVLGCGCHL
ncbi:unnamed protein product [Heligmosomoides polygyrus]|uniref:Tyrosine-protein phosphatase domain-containing protein n=1 Tax=Heligmosomoides polygyrus TaxID=6339 RepID=A0A183F8M2_HELPZ|nr:unnamed protein product [Heligmosomoides polygyrus]